MRKFIGQESFSVLAAGGIDVFNLEHKYIGYNLIRYKIYYEYAAAGGTAIVVLKNTKNRVIGMYAENNSSLCGLEYLEYIGYNISGAYVDRITCSDTITNTEVLIVCDYFYEE